MKDIATRAADLILSAIIMLLVLVIGLIVIPFLRFIRDHAMFRRTRRVGKDCNQRMPVPPTARADAIDSSSKGKTP